MLGLARPVGASSSHHVSATRCQVPARGAPALKWVAMASAMVTKLPLNMLTPDTSCLPELKTRDMRAIRQLSRVFSSFYDLAFAIGGPLNSDSMTMAT